MRQKLETSFAGACFGVACTIGLLGAFVGLETRSLWLDELYTAGIVEPIGRAGDLWTRIAGDLNSPLYFIVLFVYSKLAGTSDAALRGFSALCACGAVLIFVTATRRSFSLLARLFGSAMATGSVYWFVQSQNARNYALALLVGAGILALCLALLEEARRREPAPPRLLFPLIALMFIGAFTHFYLVFESVAALMVLALWRPRQRLLMAGTAVALLAVSFLYLKLFVATHSQILMGNYWIQNNLAWYVFELRFSSFSAFGKLGRATVAICIAAVAARALWTGLRRGEPSASGAVPLNRFPFDPVTTLLVGVPVLMLMAAVSSSLLVAPNFASRYLLICAPFLWGLCARLYDVAQAGAPRLFRLTLDVVLAAATLAMATLVSSRIYPSDITLLWSEPFRSSAEWIRGLPECRGQMIPVITNDGRGWYKPGYAEDIYDNAYARYLRGFARPELVFGQDILPGPMPAALKAEMQRRIDGQGCSVLGWSAHYMTGGQIAALRDEILKATDRPGAASLLEAKEFRDGFQGYVLYVKRKP